MLSSIFAIVAIVNFDRFIYCAGVSSTDIVIEGSKSYPYVQFDDKIYLIESSLKLNWFGAVSFCRYRRMRLASPETVEETKRLSDYLVKEGFEELFWLSGSDLEKKHEFVWLETGRPFRYNKWGKGQPDNINNIERCVNLWKQDGEYEWNDNVCEHDHHIICEASPKTFSLLIW